MDYNKIFRLDKKLIFVLGGSGYIGREIVKGLVALGGKVVVLDQHKIDLPKNVNFYPINLEKSISYKKSLTL